MSPSRVFSEPTGKFDQSELTVLREETDNQSVQELRAHAVAGLSETPKRLSSKYFYDDAGSEIFARITDEDEYYLTRTEHRILTEHAADVVRELRGCSLGRGGAEMFNVVELGAGDGRKTKVLLRAMLDEGVDFEYLPIDISRGAMADLFKALEGDFECCEVRMHGIVGDYMQALSHVRQTSPERRTLVLFLGSSIGNFTRDSAIDFLSEVRCNLKPRDMLLVGFDLKKDPEVLRRAYSDSHNVTKEFNINLLMRLNREVDADFSATAFRHLAVYNPVRGAMESYLLSSKDHDVNVAGELVHFDSGEPILTEYSYKYLPKQALRMARKAGFASVANYYGFADGETAETEAVEPWFMEALFEIEKTG